jgi:H+/Cl- antiporter ClcA
MLLKVAAAGVMFGGCVRGFVALLHGLKKLFGRIAWPPLRPLIGGVAVIGLTALVGSDAYLGLGLPLLQDSLTGGEVPALAFALKLVFTAVTLGSGFVGGEVTPLFVMGATLGHALGAPLGLDPALLASIGMVAVFAGASKTPLACTLMAIELFGGGAALYVWVGCVMAYVAAGRHGIYPAQRNTSDDVKV